MSVLHGEDRERERDQITRALNWPVFPILPVKRRSGEPGGFPELGVVYYWHSPEMEAGGSVRVYLTSMFSFEHSAEEPAAERYPYLDYIDLDAFFDDGWRGD